MSLPGGEQGKVSKHALSSILGFTMPEAQVKGYL